MKFYSKVAVYILLLWTAIEIVICIIVLADTFNSKTHTGENFMSGLCDSDDCDGFTKKALFGRLITAVLLIAGLLTVGFTIITEFNQNGFIIKIIFKFRAGVY